VSDHSEIVSALETVTSVLRDIQKHTREQAEQLSAIAIRLDDHTRIMRSIDENIASLARQFGPPLWPGKD
jgi:hypothetical protein